MPTSSTRWIAARWIAGCAIAVCAIASCSWSAVRAADKADEADTSAKVEAPADEKPTDPVRVLTAKAPIDPFRKLESSVLTTAEELEKAVGKASAEELAKQVDFEKESVVAFAFTTGGPPFGEPKSEMKKDGEKEWIEFYVQEPDSPVRGRALKFGRAFFAVPKGAEVKFGAKRNG